MPDRIKAEKHALRVEIERSVFHYAHAETIEEKRIEFKALHDALDKVMSMIPDTKGGE